MGFGVEAQHLSAIFHGVNANGLDIDMVGRSAKAHGAEWGCRDMPYGGLHSGGDEGKKEGNPSFGDARNRQEIACAA
uniref:Uncharacterized protein n=1 Tax=Oryza meridionalis TaxID=40149 RepID=A0A0E0DM39_9ORYZ